MDVVKLPDILRNGFSPDQAQRNAAEAELKAALEQHWAGALQNLCTVMADENNNENHIRRMAGLLIKNQLDIREKADAHVNQVKTKWFQIQQDIRESFKVVVLRCLQSRFKDVRDGAAEVASKIAVLELPEKQWPEFISIMCNNITGNTAPELKQASLVALGYTCEELNNEVLQQYSNNILTAVICGMNAEYRKECDVVLAATMALYNVLELTQSNFDAENESDVIMAAIITAAESGATPEIQSKAMECLVGVASLYYVKLNRYIQKIFDVTFKAIKTDTSEDNIVAMQAIEFWNTVCEEEISIMELLDDIKNGYAEPDPTVQCFYFIRGVLPPFVPLLLECLLKQDEHQEDVSTNISLSAGTCLSLFAANVKDGVLPIVLPFVNQYIKNPEWRFREAAMFAFGSILNGPESEIIEPHLGHVLPVIMTNMQDQHHLVKDSAAWVVSRLCEYHSAIISPHFPNLIPPLLHCLGDTPQVAAHCAWAICNIAIEGKSLNLNQTQLTEMISKLIAAADREDSAEANLRTTCYQTIQELINQTPRDAMDMLKQLISALMNKLAHTLRPTGAEKTVITELQSHLCASLEVATRKLAENDDLKPFADALMELYLKVLSQSQTTVNEDAIMAISVLCNAVGADFIKYMPAFFNFLCIGLHNYNEKMGCLVCIGVVGDICRALEGQMEQYAGQIMQLLMIALSSSELSMEVKPQIFSCFGDIALAVGSRFEIYLESVSSMLQQATQVDLDDKDPEMYDYLNKLRESICDAFTGIIQGFNTDGKAAVLLPKMQLFVNYINYLGADPNLPDDVLKSAVGVLGDIADTVGKADPNIKKMLASQGLVGLINRCKACDSKSCKETGAWAASLIGV
mmetsp:Transcript_42713/g.107818  ORF Transcript_42713/g.107818 Transcript_42713/m.107818 type:complete len:861 (-) Transcript_42713:364-2946(-)|eukprot:CAMPEP_0177646238 /NCGR_PEP_ID=MMETSP0447-20121125/9670_1 /TAXON_ID=0 /ORGANISM="Stygamoeba regulata, Strain BSH-02190019" /LENGTH=860 /DNA_ID=CAMNT_0019148763 /DNA_START=51 /DNA_END=2633 /DNA_ORIENTATION=-